MDSAARGKCKMWIFSVNGASVLFNQIHFPLRLFRNNHKVKVEQDTEYYT